MSHRDQEEKHGPQRLILHNGNLVLILLSSLNTNSMNSCCSSSLFYLPLFPNKSGPSDKLWCGHTVLC